jgi:type IV fimbrial biogenesis protein FimT
MFVDTDGDGLLDSSEEIVREGQALPAQLTMFGTAATYGTAILFDATGRSASGAGAFVVCSGGALTAAGLSTSRVIAVNSSGRVRLGVDSNGDGIPETDAGAPTNCTTP